MINYSNTPIVFKNKPQNGRITSILISEEIFSKILWIFMRWTKKAITQPIFKIFAKKIFYMGPHYLKFTFVLVSL